MAPPSPQSGLAALGLYAGQVTSPASISSNESSVKSDLFALPLRFGFSFEFIFNFRNEQLNID
jgi:hypothetical protein